MTPPAGRNLWVLTGGFLSRRHRMILALAGWRVRPALPGVFRPGPGDRIGVWGRSALAWRGEALAARTGLPLLRVEDPFLRSLHPGRAGSATLGLLLDETGVHFDASAPSDIETLLKTAGTPPPIPGCRFPRPATPW